MLLTPELEVKFEEAFLTLGYGICGDEVVMSLDTLQNFRDERLTFADKGFCTKDSETVFIVEKTQVKKGDRRTDLAVIDFGDFRAVYNV